MERVRRSTSPTVHARVDELTGFNHGWDCAFCVRSFFFFFFLIRCAGSSSVEKLSQDGHAWDRSLCFVTWFLFADSRCKCLLLFLDMEGAKWNAVFANTAFEVDFCFDLLTS